MAPFRFRLEKVLELRRNRELDAAVRLAAARSDAAAAEQVWQVLAAAREAGLARMAEVHGLGGSAGQLQNLAEMLRLLESHVAEAEVALEEAEGAVQQQTEGLALAVRERQLMATLRERQKLAWSAAEIAADRKRMDDIALSRHLRGAGPESAGTA